MPCPELLLFLIWQMYQAAGQLGGFQIPELLLLTTKSTEIYTEVTKMYSLWLYFYLLVWRQFGMHAVNLSHFIPPEILFLCMT